MANWIKWWKSKFVWSIIGLMLSAMILSFPCAYFLTHPWGLIGTILICLPIGIVIRKMIIKKINEFVDNL